LILENKLDKAIHSISLSALLNASSISKISTFPLLHKFAFYPGARRSSRWKGPFKSDNFKLRFQ